MKSNKELINKKVPTNKESSSKSKSSTTKPKIRSSKNENDETKSSKTTESKTTSDHRKEEKQHILQKKSTSEKNHSSTNKTSSTSKSSKTTDNKKTVPSEKRGNSTIYVPKSNALRNSISTPKKQSSENTKTLRSRKIEQKSSGDNLLKPKIQKTKSIPNKINKQKQLDTSNKILKSDQNDIEEDYEDDFEDYESDFQECSVSEISDLSDEHSSEMEPIEMKTKEKPISRVIHSAVYRKTEEEKRFDSGHYELAEARKRAKLDTTILETFNDSSKEEEEEEEEKPPVIESFNVQYSASEEKQVETKSLPLSTDEGFVEDRSGDFAKSPTISQTSLTEIKKPKMEVQSKRNRALELMNMIKLETISISLFECKPIPYEDFVKIFGKLNARQIAVQTKEDNLDIEIQTDDIETSNKWTQFPVVCRSSLNTAEDIMNFQMEQVGVGEDFENVSSEDIVLSPTYDILRLNEFLSRAGKVILSLLEKSKMGGNILQNEPHELSFSEGFIQLSTSSLSFLCHRPVTKIQYSDISNKILMTIHAPEKEGDYKKDEETRIDYTSYCIGCVWNISEPSRPTKVFYSRSEITASCFHPMNYNIIFGGTSDGSINIWNLKEDEMWHKGVTDKINESEWVLRGPSYTTAGNVEVEGHHSEIVAINVLSKIDKNISHISSNKFIPIQICSLDSEGGIIIWSVISNLMKNNQDINASIWGEIKLNKSQEITLNFKGASMTKDAMCEFRHMKNDNANVNNLYVATNTTNIMHASCIGAKVNPIVYKTNAMDLCGGTTCIEACPFEKSYFMVGCNDGSIRLHSSNLEQSLLQLKVKNYSSPIQTIQWSKSKPFSIYVLDEKSRIHVWDLGNSDVLPMQTVTATKRGHIISMQLSPCNVLKDLNDQYLAIGTNTGRVEVHKLKQEFYYSQVEDINREMNAFAQYISIL